MAGEELLHGKRILAVDDEKDVLEIIQEQLAATALTVVSDFRSAEALLEEERFDLVILDIMGVRGFELLETATRNKTPAVMLTAHAMTPESLQKSIDLGAVSFLPKNELARLAELTQEILEGVQEGKTHWPRLIERLGPTFKEMWGQLWNEIRFPKDPGISW